MGREIAAQDIARIQAVDAPRHGVASIRARAGGYIVDMVIFAAVAMVMFVAGGVVLLASSDWAQQNVPDAALYGGLAVVGLGTPLAWSAMNLLLLATRRQTAGQYVAGLRLAREDGRPVSGANTLAWWFALNPLLFSWPMAAVTLLPFAGTVALILSRATLGVFVAVALLCIAAPVIALVSSAVDGANRTLHDRIVGTIVVPA